MIVPQYWAESRAQHRQKGRQVTVRRFGWSDTSQTEAQANADVRVQEALQRLLAGEKLLRREPKIPYNGAEGVPIREEIVDRHGETIITRNAYGARCLNTPNVLFVDIDFNDKTPTSLSLAIFALLMLCSAVTFYGFVHSRLLLLILAVLALLVSSVLATVLHRAIQRAKGGAEGSARRRISAFVDRHPEWSLRLYRTPAGMRVLATHQTFSPSDPDVAASFAALKVDPLYARMCLNQQCFRARVSAKPWRIGIAAHMRPRPGVWPIAPEQLPIRQAWVEKYEAAAKSFSACTYIETVGSGSIQSDTRRVQELHDALCRATSGLPMA